MIFCHVLKTAETKEIAVKKKFHWFIWRHCFFSNFRLWEEPGSTNRPSHYVCLKVIYGAEICIIKCKTFKVRKIVKQGNVSCSSEDHICCLCLNVFSSHHQWLILVKKTGFWQIIFAAQNGYLDLTRHPHKAWTINRKEPDAFNCQKFFSLT